MIYGKPCKPYPSGLAKTGKQLAATLPRTTIGGPNSIRYIYSVVPDLETTYCTPTGVDSWATQYSIYMQELWCGGEPFQFSSTARLIEEGEDPSVTWDDSYLLTGPKVGELVDNGSGVLEGEISHPSQTGSIYLEVFPVSSCPTNISTVVRINGERQAPEFGSFSYGSVGDYWQTTLDLGGIWYEEDCGETLGEGAYDGFPPWYYSLPTYNLSGGTWNDQLREGSASSEYSCTVYGSGFFFGSRDIYRRIWTPSTCTLLRDGSREWEWVADLEGRCGGNDEEKLRAWLALGLNDTVHVSFGVPYQDLYADAAHTIPANFHGSTDGYAVSRRYMPAGAINGGSGWDWLGSSILNRQSEPSDGSLDPKYFSGPAPDQLTLTASIIA